MSDTQVYDGMPYRSQANPVEVWYVLKLRNSKANSSGNMHAFKRLAVNYHTPDICPGSASRIRYTKRMLPLTRSRPVVM